MKPVTLRPRMSVFSSIIAPSNLAEFTFDRYKLASLRPAFRKAVFEASANEISAPLRLAL